MNQEKVDFKGGNVDQSSRFLETADALLLVDQYRDSLRASVHQLLGNNPYRPSAAKGRLVLDIDGVGLGKVKQRIDLLNSRNRHIAEAQDKPEQQRMPWDVWYAKLTHYPNVDFDALLNDSVPPFRSLRDLLVYHPQFKGDRAIYRFYNEIVSPAEQLYGLLPAEPTSVNGSGWMVPEVLERLFKEQGIVLDLWCTGTPAKFIDKMKTRLEQLGAPKGVPIKGRDMEIPHDHIQIWRAAVASLVAEEVPKELVFAVDNVQDMAQQIHLFRKADHPAFNNVIGLHYTVENEGRYSVNWHNFSEVTARFMKEFRQTGRG